MREGCEIRTRGLQSVVTLDFGRGFQYVALLKRLPKTSMFTMDATARAQSPVLTRRYRVTLRKDPLDHVCANVLLSAPTCTLRPSGGEGRWPGKEKAGLIGGKFNSEWTKQLP